MVVFATASGLPVLLAARVAQGLATGAAVGAIGAGLVDLHPTRGPVANAAGAMAGTASGAIGSALLVQLLPAPTELVYFLLMGVFLIQAAAVLGIAETSPRGPGARRALRPTLGLPRRVRSALAIAAPSSSPSGHCRFLRLARSVAGRHRRTLALDDPRRRLAVRPRRERLAQRAGVPSRRPAPFRARRHRARDRRRARRPVVGLDATTSSGSSSGPPSPAQGSAAGSRAACGRSSRSPARQNAQASSPSPTSSATWRWACPRSSPGSS